MDSDTLNLLLHLKQLSKPISSDLHTNLLYLVDVCVCVCVVCDVRVVGGMYLNTVVIVFVASVRLSLLMNVFICT